MEGAWQRFGGWGRVAAERVGHGAVQAQGTGGLRARGGQAAACCGCAAAAGKLAAALGPTRLLHQGEPQVGAPRVAVVAGGGQVHHTGGALGRRVGHDEHSVRSAALSRQRIVHLQPVQVEQGPGGAGQGVAAGDSVCGRSAGEAARKADAWQRQAGVRGRGAPGPGRACGRKP